MTGFRLDGEDAEAALEAATTLEPKNLRISASGSRWAGETVRRRASASIDVRDAEVEEDRAEAASLRLGYLCRSSGWCSNRGADVRTEGTALRGHARHRPSLISSPFAWLSSQPSSLKQTA